MQRPDHPLLRGDRPPAARRAARTSGHRFYSEADLRRLLFIRRCRDFGFPIEQVRALVELTEASDRDCNEARDLARRPISTTFVGSWPNSRRSQRTLVGFVESCTAACAGGPASECVMLDDLAEAGPAALLCLKGGVAMTLADNKAIVQRLVNEVINGRRLDALDELCAPVLAPKLRLAFMQFLEAFADWRQPGDWLGLPATGRRIRIDEVYFFRIENGRLARLWGLEDT